jgi:chromosome partitioning protein
MDASAAMKDVLKICCYNYKGGCGKTTIMVNAAAACAKQGKKVLQIDLDPQCNTTQFCGTQTTKWALRPRPGT